MVYVLREVTLIVPEFFVIKVSLPTHSVPFVSPIQLLKSLHLVQSHNLNFLPSSTSISTKEWVFELLKLEELLQYSLKLKRSSLLSQGIWTSQGLYWYCPWLLYLNLNCGDWCVQMRSKEVQYIMKIESCAVRKGRGMDPDNHA